MRGRQLDRRAALGLLGAGTMLPAVAAAPATAAMAFAHGVASGDPTAQGAILWTRLTTDSTGAVPVRWHVADGEAVAF